MRKESDQEFYRNIPEPHNISDFIFDIEVHAAVHHAGMAMPAW